MGGVDAGTAWASGYTGTILKTTDGGSLWQKQISGTSRVLFGMYALDPQNVWVVGSNGVILKNTPPGPFEIQPVAGLGLVSDAAN